MFDGIIRAHNRVNGIIGFAILMFAIWTSLFCYSVMMLSLGRTEALICFVGATLVVKEPLKFWLALLPVARLAEERGARIRAIRARRDRRR